MQSTYPAEFSREMGCTEAEWLGWLPAALGAHPHQQQGQSVRLQIGSGTLALAWRVGAPRVIGLIRMPRLHVDFRFDGVDDAQRHAFMQRFDLYMQRGGG